MARAPRPVAVVLGAAGFIGRHTVREFLERGYRVTAVARRDRAAADLPEHPRLQYCAGQLRDEEFVRGLLHRADVVVCLAPNSLPATSNEDLVTEIGTQVQTTLRIAEMAHQAGARNFVFASSGGTVYGLDSPTPIPETAQTRPRNAYGVSKLAIEHYLRIMRDLRGLRTVALRIANPYGVGQNAASGQGFIAMAMRRAHSGEPLAIFGDGKAVRDFLYVRDLAEAIVLAAEYEGAEPVMNIGSGLGYSLLEIAGLVEEITGRRLRLKFESNRKIDVGRNVLDIGLALRELGWRPRTPIEAGLQMTAEWWADRRITQG
jgi:UDP-glucose 4-epimerase